MKEHLKSHELGSQLSIDSKLSRREKLKAKKAHNEAENKEFFERTGINVDGNEEFGLDNIVAKYKFESEQMAKEEFKKFKRLFNLWREQNLTDNK